MRKISNTGFTVIELLAALLILMIGVLGLAVLTSVAVQGNDLSDEVSIAAILAREKLEELKRLGYDDLRLKEGTYLDPSNPIESGNYSNSAFNRKWEVFQSSAKANVKTIRVTVSWTNSGEHSIIMSTMIVKG